MISLAYILASAPPADLSREFVFAQPWVLWLLLPVLGVLLLRRRRGAATCVQHPTAHFVAPLLHRPSVLAGRVGPVCFALAAAALVVALARPQWKNRVEEQKVSGIDIMIACDLSYSMNQRDMTLPVGDLQKTAALSVITAKEDMDVLRSYYGSRRMQELLRSNRRLPVRRLTAAQHVIKDFVAGRPNDRIGVVAFAGKAKLGCPLTLDHGRRDPDSGELRPGMVEHIIDQFCLANGRGREGYISEDGTAIGTAIASAATRLQERPETKSKVIILVTDGMNNMGSISPDEAARQAAKMGIKIFTIAIGVDERISAFTAEVDPIDEKTLRNIAKETGGRFFRAGSSENLQKAFSRIDKLEKTDATRRVLESYEELFPYPIGLACLLLALGCLFDVVLPKPAP
ncbi:MAG: VWA domain-containing protein [Akkermansia muciniphila]|nr:VWA domain-containing protein [Akkermansia muciniphila]